MDLTGVTDVQGADVRENDQKRGIFVCPNFKTMRYHFESLLQSAFNGPLIHGCGVQGLKTLETDFSVGAF
jgi:hypothetical protein